MKRKAVNPSIPALLSKKPNRMSRLTLMSTLLLILCSVLRSRAEVAVPQTIIQGDDLSSMVWPADSTLTDVSEMLKLFSDQPISDTTFNRMKGRSYPARCPIARSDLRYLIIPHFDGRGNIRIGEMVCNRAIASDLIEIFKELFRQRYPIEKMRLIDDFNGDDEASMAANNTSCFNYRRVAGSRSLSLHARGMAVDINPLYNPMVGTTRKGILRVSPSEGKPYADRTQTNPYFIRRGDSVWQLFRRHDFTWGGSWRTKKDYQHFQKR